MIRKPTAFALPFFGSTFRAIHWSDLLFVAALSFFVVQKPQETSTIVQTGAILIGGWWAYMSFVRQRIGFPKGKVRLAVTHIPMDDHHNLIHAALTFENVGLTAVCIEQFVVRFQLVTPLDDLLAESFEKAKDGDLSGFIEKGRTTVSWPELKGYTVSRKLASDVYEVEPGEEERITADALVNSNTKVIRVYAYIRNAAKKGVGWNCEEFYSINAAVSRH